MSKKEKKKKEKHIYEIWTYIFDMEKMKDKKIGRCHGRFKKKKQAEEVLRRLAKQRKGEPNSIYSDGTKEWRFKIIEQTINDVEEYKDYGYQRLAVYNEEKKEWIVNDGDKTAFVLDLTPVGIERAYAKLYKWSSEADAPDENDEKVSPPKSFKDPF